MKCLTIRQYSVLSLNMHSLMPAVRHVYIEAGNVYLLIFMRMFMACGSQDPQQLAHNIICLRNYTAHGNLHCYCAYFRTAFRGHN